MSVPETGYWDHAFLSEILAEIGPSERTVVVIPGAYQGDVIPRINTELAKYEKVLVIVTSDEENKFDVRKLEHPDMIVYSQYGNGGRMFPLGYAPETREILKEIGPIEKDQEWFFAGQITHHRRQQLALQLMMLPNGEFHGTDGFAKGLGRKEYLYGLARSKVAPCAPGPISVDSFRLYEALEAGCVPIVDEMSPLRSAGEQYFLRMFGSWGFPVFTDYTQLPFMINETLRTPDANNQVFAWWINQKYMLKSNLQFKLGAFKEDMAVIIPVSPIPSHPDTAILEETIKSVRVHTSAPILVTIDGVREEQKHMEENYREFIRRFLWKCNFEYKDVLPILFSKHSHQSGMMKEVLKNLSLPYLLYVEQDTPLTPDREIPLEELKMKLNDYDVIRFHFEAFVPEPHRHLMIGSPQDNLQKTSQWSQRPHLASTEYYRRIMSDNFSEESNTFIEDRMHSICQVQPWEKNRLAIYHPDGDIKRSYHLDGRAGAEKYDDKLRY